MNPGFTFTPIEMFIVIVGIIALLTMVVIDPNAINLGRRPAKARDIKRMTDDEAKRADDELRARNSRVSITTTQNSDAPIFVKANGCLLFDRQGNEYIDLCSTIGAANLGHYHPDITSALLEFMAEQFANPSVNSLINEHAVKLKEKLVSITPGKFEKKAALFYGGARAVEAAMKIAMKDAKKRLHRKARFAIFENDFHGRTGWALQYAHDRAEVHRRDFVEELNRGPKIPFPDWNEHSFQPHCDAYKRKVIKEIEEETGVLPYTSFIYELVQGEGGIHVACFDCMRLLAEVLRKRGILLIVDEVQTGFGRTGRMFASEYFGFEPDVMIFGKSLSPELLGLSGIVTRADLNYEEKGCDSITGPGALQCAMALKSIELLEALDTQEMREKIALLSQVATEGLGLMRCIRLRNTAGRDEFIKAAYNEHLYLIGAGDDAVRVYPPLTIPVDLLKEAVSRLRSLKKKFDIL